MSHRSNRNLLPGKAAWASSCVAIPLDAEHVSLFSLVAFAYHLRDVQLSGGPAWVKSGVLVSSELYQVIAKTTGDPPPAMEVFRQMLQALLAKRFQLRLHHVSRDLPIYNLVVGKSGPKLKESPADAKFNFVASSVGRLGTKNCQPRT